LRKKVPVKSWFDDVTDCELRELIPLFEKLSKVDSVYSVLCNSNQPLNNQTNQQHPQELQQAPNQLHQQHQQQQQQQTISATTVITQATTLSAPTMLNQQQQPSPTSPQSELLQKT